MKGKFGLSLPYLRGIIESTWYSSTVAAPSRSGELAMAGENRMGRDHLSVGHIRLPLRSIGKSFEHLYGIRNQAIDDTHRETGDANDEAC